MNLKVEAAAKPGFAPPGTSSLAPLWARHGSWMLAVLLGLGTIALYWPAIHFDFLDYDDDAYVTANTMAQHGLTWDALKWEFTHSFGGNWHPLTMLSHTLDCQWYGLNPGGHHLTSVLLHGLNAALVFILFRRLTGALWPGACVAALFAWHPLHVESVAWISERKDVLSTCFGLLAFLAYARFAREQQTSPPGLELGRHPFLKSRSYWLAWLCLAFGLLSKPMLVTWPFLFLLLDYWPLNRVRSAECEARTEKSGEQRPGRNFKMLLVEKVPFFALALAASVLTFLVQSGRGATQSLAYLPLSLRCENALISCCRYLVKMFWPTGLAAFYPHPGRWPMGNVIAAGVFLAVITWLLWTYRRQRPYLPWGWFWFLGTLVPVLGIVQVGRQAMADRYTYVPSLGVFVLVIWGLGDLSRRWRVPRQLLALLAVGVLVACCAVTRHQLAYWQNSETLFQHALRVTADNDLARNNLGNDLLERGRIDAAIEQFRAALQLKPDCVEAYNNLGSALLHQGETNGAIDNFRKAIQFGPHFALAYGNLANTLVAVGQPQEAEELLRSAISNQPDYFQAHNNLAVLLSLRGQTNEAAVEFQLATWLQPNDVDAHRGYGRLLAREGQVDAALNQYQAAIQLKPQAAGIRQELGNLFASIGQAELAAGQFEEAVRLDTNNAEVYFLLGNLYVKSGMKDRAISRFLQAVRARPDFPEARNNLGSLLSAQGRLPEAIAQFREAVRVRPDYLEAQYNLGNSLFKSGQMDEAAGQYRAVIQRSPEFAPAHFYLGLALAKEGLTNEAIVQFREAVRLRPNDAVARNRLGLALGGAGQWDDAIGQFQEALRLKPEYAEASNNLAHARSAQATH